MGAITGRARRGRFGAGRWVLAGSMAFLLLVPPGLSAHAHGMHAGAPPHSGILSFPTAIAFGAGSIYVADSGHFRIVRLSWTGKLLGKWGTEGSGPGQFGDAGQTGLSTGSEIGPTSIATDRAGNVYVADAGNQRVEKFSESGSLESAWGINPADYVIRQMALTVGPRGNLIVAMSGSADCPDGCLASYLIERLSPAGSVLAQWSASPSDIPGMKPTIITHLALTTDATGAIYVAITGLGACTGACPAFGTVQKWSCTGTLLAHWPSDGEATAWQPLGLAQGTAANMAHIGSATPYLYVADGRRGGVERWSTTGALLAEWGGRGHSSGQFEQPWGLAVDWHGNVWVADSGNNRIQRLSSAGKVTALWTVDRHL